MGKDKSNHPDAVRRREAAAGLPKRSPAEQLAALDERLGQNVGALRERKRLVKQMTQQAGTEKLLTEIFTGGESE